MVTVLMATYQGKKYLEQQLDSILAQTVPVRIFVSDDGSDDGTREMLAQYGEWYPEQVFLKHRAETAAGAEHVKRSLDVADGGADAKVPPAAQNFFWLLNCAAREGKSDYIMLSDQDDVWFNDKVKRLLARMKRLEQAMGAEHPVLVYSDMEVVEENLEQIHPSFFAYQHCDPERTSFPEVLVENPVTGGAMMMNRALLDLVTGVRRKTADGRRTEPDEGQTKPGKVKLPAACCMHDWWIALVASCFGTISCVGEPLYQYRQHGANTLGAKATGSLGDMTTRPGRHQQVKENYRRMLEQAAAFGRRYGKRMSEEQKEDLRAFLAMPSQSPAERLQIIRERHMYKSTLTQTLGMCVFMPRVVRAHAGVTRQAGGGRKSGNMAGEDVAIAKENRP